jgi:hypothetical protein
MIATAAHKASISALDERIVAASADIRNALVPMQTIASLLQRPEGGPSPEWCAWMLEREVKRIVDILDAI